MSKLRFFLKLFWVMNFSYPSEHNQDWGQRAFLLLTPCKTFYMMFSKSFGYALRGILYVALMQEERRKVQAEEIANKLSVPRHFLGKIMQLLVKAGLLQSTKGPYGGFFLAPGTLKTPLIKLVEITDGIDQFDICVLQLRQCSKSNPCPLHTEMDIVKTKLKQVLTETTFEDLLSEDKKIFIDSLSVR